MSQFGNGKLNRSVAILAQIIKPFDCENAHRVVVCTGIKDDIMVIIGRIKNQYNQNPDDMGNDDWQLGTYEQISARLDNEFKELKQVHPVDLVCIGTKTDPRPLKDVPDDYLDTIEGQYLGHTPLIPALNANIFHFTVEGRRITTSRWVMCAVDDA